VNDAQEIRGRCPISQVFTMNRFLLAFLPTLLFAVRTAADLGFVSDGVWRSGRVYSVYDPHYGRATPEVKRNTNGRGNPLTIGGKAFAKGFGAWRFSVIELDVPTGARGIAGLVGIDAEESGRGGDTIFSIRVDGQDRWQSPSLSRLDPPVAFSLPVTGAATIELLTDAQGYSNGDLADWCDLRWLDATPKQSTLYRPEAGSPHIRAELHPCHLAYQGESLPITVIADRPQQVAVRWSITTDDKTVRDGEIKVALLSVGAGVAIGGRKLTLELPNGMYELRLQAAGTVERVIPFGVIESRIGRPTGGSIYGVNHHEFASSYEPLAAIGVEWSRQWFCWAWIEPEPDVWQWGWHDQRMAAATRFGIKTIGVLGGIGEPLWSCLEHPRKNGATTQGCPDLDAWSDYVRRVATRYRGKIRVWESWNEIKRKAEPEKYGWSVAKYVALHRRTWDVLKEVDPDNRLLVCADSLAFVDRCLEAGLGKAHDGVVIHPYRTGWYPEAKCASHAVGGTGDIAAVMTTARTWLDQRQRSDAGVWATEIGWALSGRGWAPVLPQTHGDYLARTYILAQGAGCAASVCWHDYGHGMFGVVGPRAHPRPALLQFGGLISRLADAHPVKRWEPAGTLHAWLFQRADRDVLAIWSEKGTAFAALRPERAIAARLYDANGNGRDFRLPTSGRTIAVTGSPSYLETSSLKGLSVEPREPIEVDVPDRVIAGRTIDLRCLVRNVSGEDGELRVTVGAADGITVTPAAAVTVAAEEEATVVVPISISSDAPPGFRSLDVTTVLPGGFEAPLIVPIRIDGPLLVTVESFDSAAFANGPVTIDVTATNTDREQLSGELTVTPPDGFTARPAQVPIEALPAGGSVKASFTVSAGRETRPGDRLRFRFVTGAGAVIEVQRALRPTIVDADGDGLADGWTLNAQGGTAERPNLVTTSIEPGWAEFHCQRIDCTQFGGGWIILHRDGQDRVEKGRRYRITLRARQEGLDSTVGAAVFNLRPWENCGIEHRTVVGPDWREYCHEFSAKRDSDRARFEFYFTETGTVWIEGMRLEAIGE
jgi:hypothetical protein